MIESIKVIELDCLHRFRSDLLADASSGSVERNIRWYLQYFDGLSIRFGYDRPIVRARVCNSSGKFNNIAELHSPPPNITKIGRMNDKGRPMFYAAYHIGTALAEIDAKEGDLVQIASFKLPDESRSGMRCLVIGEAFNAYHGVSTISQVVYNELRRFIERLGNRDIKALLSFLYMDALAAELLRL